MKYKVMYTAEDFDFFQWIIIWYFTKQMIKLK